MRQQENPQWPDLPGLAGELLVGPHGDYLRAVVVRRGDEKVEIHAGGKYQNGDRVLAAGVNMDEARRRAQLALSEETQSVETEEGISVKQRPNLKGRKFVRWSGKHYTELYELVPDDWDLIEKIPYLPAWAEQVIELLKSRQNNPVSQDDINDAGIRDSQGRSIYGGMLRSLNKRLEPYGYSLRTADSPQIGKMSPLQLFVIKENESWRR